jgi:hypothetical protein
MTSNGTSANDIAFVNKQLENTRKNRSDTVGEPQNESLLYCYKALIGLD